MLDSSIKLIKFSLKNYAPFYESMGLKYFSFDRSTSPNSIVLILAGNGVGKTYLLSELTPEPFESQIGRLTNRFIDNEEGEKNLTYLVDDCIEYNCKIIYSADRRKTTCFFSKKIGDKEEELNPNGNVGSYLELCRVHLGYYKTYKNVGHISDTIKNIVTMSPNERQSLISTWLPNMEEFLNASKLAQKKYNQTDREIKGLAADIAKISFDEYVSKRSLMEENLKDTKNKLQLIRDNISKIEVYLGQMKNLSRQNLNEKRKEWETKLAEYEKCISENTEVYSKYSKYLTNENGEKELQSLLLEKEKELIEAKNKEDQLNRDAASLSMRIDKLQGELNFDKTNDEDLLSITASIDLLTKDIESTNEELDKIYSEHPSYKRGDFVTEAKDFTKIVLNTFENFCSTINKMKTFCNGFSVKDIFEQTVIEKLEMKITKLMESNSELEKNISKLEENILEKERGKIDSSILSFAPKSCSKETCALIAELVKRSKIDNDIGGLRSDILEKKLQISNNNSEIERTKMTMNDVKNTLVDVNNINDSIMKINDKFVYFPEDLLAKVNSSDPSFIIDNINDIINGIKDFDEFLSVLEKNVTAKASLTNLNNAKTILSMKASKNDELNELLKDLEAVKSVRAEANEKLKKVQSERDEITALLSDLVRSIDIFSELSKTREELEYIRQALLDENKGVYYKTLLETFMSSLKMKEIDYSTIAVNLEKDINQCNTLIASRETLVSRKNNLEVKKKLYEIAYNAWNSKTGYPSLVINDFLSEVAFETNKNLDENWGGLIRIGKIDVENEFKIPVIRGSKNLQDVTECSKAEKSTISLALSFAIIKVSSKNSLYNILRIDEADSGFDEVRRQAYLTTIQQEMNMINCKNAFIITHNQMFENAECDVILLKDYDKNLSAGSLKNKNIIYSFDKVGI